MPPLRVHDFICETSRRHKKRYWIYCRYVMNNMSPIYTYEHIKSVLLIEQAVINFSAQ